MAEQFRTRLRAQNQDGITEVKVLITHPMETGARKDMETGRLIPAHFIQKLQCEHNGKVVISAVWSVGVSQNPYCSFKFKGGTAGDTVILTWEDNQGNVDTATVLIE